MKLAIYRLDRTDPICYKLIAVVEQEQLDNTLKHEKDSIIYSNDNLGDLEDLGQTGFQTSPTDFYIAIAVTEDTPEVPLPAWFPYMKI